MSAPIAVMLVDDSAVVRQVLSTVLNADPDMEVIATAPDPIFAMERMKQRWPDVIVLDVEMPRMDGITFLRQLMQERPVPVVICSTLTERGAAITVDAMAAGAVGYVTKPTSGLRAFLQEDAGELIRMVKSAARSNVRVLASAAARTPVRVPSGAASSTMSAPPPQRTGDVRDALSARTTDRLVAIGTSTGGTQALEVVLTALPRTCPGIVIVQHMPEHFTAAFAERLNGLCQPEVREARDGDRVLPGQVLIAPGGLHMSVRRDGAQYRVRVVDGPRVNRHKPSVDVLFESVAKHAGANALGIIMTGMGNDGAHGLVAMLKAGAHTLGQDEKSCVVYGMPHEAKKLGAVQQEVGLPAISAAIERFGQG